MSLFSDTAVMNDSVMPLVGEITPNPRPKDRNRPGDWTRQKKEEKEKSQAEKETGDLPRKQSGEDIDRYV
ncbi:MAG: hypothetical protein JRI95_03455 [Deltaproteobacteria bacterium]|nr:hypothetical protein [Deltaproteobacteria bacterium]MBW2085332.1 hypothetical protein [Deltaproteobacteria bacterium]